MKTSKTWTHTLGIMKTSVHFVQLLNNTFSFGMSRYRTVCEEIAMPWDWPVVVNYHEAKAFCKWKGNDYRLPTEAEQWAMRDIEVHWYSNHGSRWVFLFKDWREGERLGLFLFRAFCHLRFMWLGPLCIIEVGAFCWRLCLQTCKKSPVSVLSFGDVHLCT